jgi:23S rRNA (uracil1939-C5)-methyltransferase
MQMLDPHRSSTFVGPHCSHRPPCPGCPFFGGEGLAPATRTRVLRLAQHFQVDDVEFITGPALGYRHRVRLAFRGRASNPKLGLFEAGNHQVVTIPNCVVHHAAINATAAWLKAELRRLHVAPYSEQAHAGLVRYVQLAVERATGRVQVVLVGNSERVDPLLPVFEHLERTRSDQLHSLVFNANSLRTNAVLGPHFELVWGAPQLVDQVGGARVFYPAGAFSQANPVLFDVLVQHLHSWIEHGVELVELYAGVGAIGLGLVQRCSKVVFNEVAPRSLEGLGLGLAALPLRDQSKISVVAGDAVEGVGHVGADATVIVDPPRKGLAPEVLTALCERTPRHVIYVSCGIDAFERDAAGLVAAGYVLARVRAVALFPFTDHVELLAEFRCS